MALGATTHTIAAVGDSVYNVVLLVHLLAMTVGAGMAFAGPILMVRARRQGGRSTQDFAQAATESIVFTALLLAGILGGALVGFSDDVWDFSQLWLAIAGPLWMVSLVLAAAAWPPPYIKVFNVGPERRRMLSGLLHLAIVAMFVIMIWKPGL